jgi:hypothetical protein
MSRGPRARTDVENEQALADLATMPVRSRKSTRRTVVEEELDDFEDGTEVPKANSKSKSSAKWSDYKMGRWQCPSCKTWTRDPSHRSCLACRGIG